MILLLSFALLIVNSPPILVTMESTRFLYDHLFSPPFGYGYCDLRQTVLPNRIRVRDTYLSKISMGPPRRRRRFKLSITTRHKFGRLLASLHRNSDIVTLILASSSMDPINAFCLLPSAFTHTKRKNFQLQLPAFKFSLSGSFTLLNIFRYWIVRVPFLSQKSMTFSGFDF